MAGTSTSTSPDWKANSATCCRSSAIATGSWLPIRPIRRSRSRASRPLSPARISFAWFSMFSTPLRRVRHVRANVYADKELAFVREIDAPGIDGLPQGTRSRAPRRSRGVHCRTSRSSPGSTSPPRFSAFCIIKTEYDDSLHLCLLRTRLRLLERRGGATTPPGNAGFGFEIGQPTMKGTYRNGIEQARIASIVGRRMFRPGSLKVCKGPGHRLLRQPGSRSRPTRFRTGFATPSSASGRTGDRSRLSRTATGTPATCTCRARRNTSTTAKLTAIHPRSATRTW